jgi:hypothetical protein
LGSLTITSSRACFQTPTLPPKRNTVPHSKSWRRSIGIRVRKIRDSRKSIQNLRSAYLKNGSLPQAPKRLADGSCLPLSRFCGQRTAWQLSRWGLPPPHTRFPLRSTCLAGGSLPRALNAAITAASNYSRWCTNEMAVGIFRRVTLKLVHTASPTILVYRSRKLFPSPTPPILRRYLLPEDSPGRLIGSAFTAKPPGCGKKT